MPRMGYMGAMPFVPVTEEHRGHGPLLRAGNAPPHRTRCDRAGIAYHPSHPAVTLAAQGQ